MSHIHPIDVILHKRDGHALSDEEIHAFIRAIVDRTPEKHLVTDAQITSFLMAVFLRGLDARELATLTSAMRYSGDTFDAAPLDTFTIDKHSTGGVGDKTSLLIAPILAAAGLAHPTDAGVPGICVPMISGRSLGHTGGTLDKLETIPGFNTQLDLKQLAETLRGSGAALIGQTPRIVPADRILYALRDHTGTVESPFLITASIMSKKLAESLNALVLDVKVGSGAFMPSYEKSKYLAELMVQTGEASGTRTVALLTGMDEPLGRFSGTWVEVWECVDILRGKRHPMSKDLIELSNILSGWMLYLAGRTSTPEAGAQLADQILQSGDAYKAWLKIVEAQGGDTSVFEDPASHHKPNATLVLKAEHAGYLSSMDCKQAGWAVQRLGAGRAKPGDPVSVHAGIESHVKLGDRIEAGQPLFTLFSEDDALLAEPERMLQETVRIEPAAPIAQPIVREIVASATTFTATRSNLAGVSDALVS
ncbi:thymidine phosphorylase [Edaphobacter modestus]|uniref:thymidine phosphorylase n=1 Tax=Edaphobacter modestus TaxID=388466 RepID=A0A4Q7Z1E3_9BACT|nr:thymidine phosphorylase [Edaphobacter modestus]RZU43363.1 pyrimidine-nucleoside phosphorylase [Edaphobacter modestus]